MTREEALQWMYDQKGKIFSVRFIKRSNGEKRQMLCRIGVRKFLKGGEAAYDFAEKLLLPVYDMEKQGYRVIPMDSLTGVKIKGKWKRIKE